MAGHRRTTRGKGINRRTGRPNRVAKPAGQVRDTAHMRRHRNMAAHVQHRLNAEADPLARLDIAVSFLRSIRAKHATADIDTAVHALVAHGTRVLEGSTS